LLVVSQLAETTWEPESVQQRPECGPRRHRNRDKAWLSKAHRLACAINIELRVALRAIGVVEASQAEALKKLLGSKSERIRRNAISKFYIDDELDLNGLHTGLFRRVNIENAIVQLAEVATSRGVGRCCSPFGGLRPFLPFTSAVVRESQGQ